MKVAAMRVDRSADQRVLILEPIALGIRIAPRRGVAARSVERCFSAREVAFHRARHPVFTEGGHRERTVLRVAVDERLTVIPTSARAAVGCVRSDVAVRAGRQPPILEARRVFAGALAPLPMAV